MSEEKKSLLETQISLPIGTIVTIVALLGGGSAGFAMSDRSVNHESELGQLKIEVALVKQELAQIRSSLQKIEEKIDKL